MSKKFVIEKFSSIDEYVKVIGQRKPNTAFAGEDSFSSEKAGKSEFAATATYQDSVALIERGFSEGLDKMLNNHGERISFKARSSRALPASSPVGYAPIVPNAILGLPNSMMSKKIVQMKTKVMSIWYDMGASCGVHSQTILTAGRHMLELIDLLEKQGYRVELNVCAFMCANKEICSSVVKVKTDKQPMNPLKIAYPILHASFLRRQGFKWLETCPKVTDRSLTDGYGTPLKYACAGPRRAFLKENKVIDENCFYTDFYEANDHDAKGLMKLMGIK